MTDDLPLVVSTAPPPVEFFAGLLSEARVVKAKDAELLDAVAEAVVVIGDWEHRIRIGAEVIARAGRCRLIQQPTAGFENIDIEAAAAAGIPVANAGPANAGAVAEHAIMLALACLRHLPEAMRDVAAGGWDQSAWIARDLPDLQERTVGCDIVYTKRSRLDGDREKELGLRFAGLDDLLRQSGVLIVCLPLNVETRGLLGAEHLSLLPRDAVVVNVARGDVMDYGALADALRNGRLAGAGLDVYPEEPLPRGHGLGDLPNVVMTPHVAGATALGKRNILINSIGNIKRVLAGERPQYVVNNPVVRVA